MRGVALTLLALGTGACSAKKAVSRTEWSAAVTLERLAVLPFANEALDVRAPEMLRSMVAQRIAARGHAVLPAEDADGRLREMGITDGGQLNALSPAEIGRRLGSDGLLYGTVEEFSFQNLGFYIKRAVRLRLKLVSAATGEIMWEGLGEGKNSRVYPDEEKMKKNLMRGWGRKALENMAGAPLRAEAEIAVRRATRKFPGRRLP